jgi:hypothetical protein
MIIRHTSISANSIDAKSKGQQQQGTGTNKATAHSTPQQPALIAAQQHATATTKDGDSTISGKASKTAFYTVGRALFRTLRWM